LVLNYNFKYLVYQTAEQFASWLLPVEFRNNLPIFTTYTAFLGLSKVTCMMLTCEL